MKFIPTCKYLNKKIYPKSVYGNFFVINIVNYKRDVNYAEYRKYFQTT